MGGSTLRSIAAMPTFLVIVLVCASAVAPSAAASHWMLYYAGVDESVGATFEDDEEVFHAPGHAFDGRRNKVVLAGKPGDGGLFLDVVVGTGVGFGSAGTTLHGDSLHEAVLGRPNVLPPGARAVSAWFGTWHDKANDGFIRDYHDALAHDEDEFKWRGLATGEPLAIAVYQVPWQPLFDAWGATDSASAHTPVTRLTDHTHPEHAEQGWSGGALGVKSDGGLLVTVHILALAGAEAQPGTRVEYNIDDPAALHDVDRYESVSSDVEPLWVNGVRGVNDAATNALPLVTEYTRWAAGEYNRLAQDALAIAGNPGAVFPLAASLLVPPDAKEPNHPDDDYGGRAFYGGSGDRLGTGNSYPGYASSYHLYADNVGRFAPACAGYHADAAGTMLRHATCMRFDFTDHDVPGQQQGARSASTLLDFRTYAFLWRDLNGDTHVGAVCNPADPERFDAEGNTCRDAPHPWPHKSGAEVRGICTVSTAKGGVLTVEPIGGSWEGVVLIRDHENTVRGDTPGRYEVLSGSDPVEIRLKEQCHGFNEWVESRDALLFIAGGSSVPLRVEGHVEIAGYHDIELDFSVGAESVLDVDILQAVL